ncbi:MAG: hypothetical protein AAGJ83_01640 [Planctomycetota bacterium]
MNQPCCQFWTDAIDADSPLSLEAQEHLKQCESCRDLHEKQVRMETALREHAQTLGTDFVWAPPAVDPTSRVNSTTGRQPTLLRLVSLAASLVLAAWLLYRAESRDSQTRPDGLGTALVDADPSEASSDTDSLVMQNRDRSTLDGINAIVRHVSSSSHMAGPSEYDDGLTYVMLYPKSPSTESEPE